MGNEKEKNLKRVLWQFHSLSFRVRKANILWLCVCVCVCAHVRPHERERERERERMRSFRTSDLFKWGVVATMKMKTFTHITILPQLTMMSHYV